jgi:hypothetical protein
MSDINVIVNDEIVNIDVIDEPVLVNVINSPGVPGAPGAPGVGVPVGGTTGQVLAKNSNTNYDTEWVDVSGGAWGTITGTLSNQTDLQNALNAKFDDPTGTTSQYLRGDGSLAAFPAIPSGTVQSVGLTMPSAFSVANSPITSSGTLAVTGAGTSAQYIRGDGQLANFPDNGGGGSSVNYYLNGSVSQGTFGGDTYYEMSKTPVLGAGTNFSRTNAQGNGYIASFITDAGDPSLLNIPGGNWSVEFYFQANSNAGNPQFYAELYKVDASNNFTLVASGSTNPEGITNGTTVDQYFTSIPVPQTSLLVTDRLAIRIYVITSGRTITLHTENSNLCEILTTFSTGLNALNGLTAQVQYFATGTSGTDFGISSATDTHTFNLPTASSVNRGALSSADWTTFNNKVPASRTLTINGVAFDLSADRSWTVAGGISGSGASGQISYWDGTTSQAGSNNFTWNNSLNLLSILYAGQQSTANVGFNLKTNTTSGGMASFAVDGNTATGHKFLISHVQDDQSAYLQNYSATQISYRDIFFLGRKVTFETTASNYASRTQVLTAHSTGNLSVGTTSDSGQRLQVQGTTLLNGNVTFSSATGMTWDATNSRLGIGTNTPSSDLSIIKSSTATVQAYIKNSSTGLVADTRIVIANDASLEGGFFIGSSTRTLDASSVLVYANRQMRFMTNNLTSTGGTDAIIFQAGGSNPSQEGMRVTGTKNILIGTTSDTGERLQVTGTAKITGNTTMSGFIFTSTNANRPWIAAVNGFASPISDGTALQINIDNSSARTATGFDFLIRSGTRDYTSGSVNVMSLNANFTPTSGTGVFTNFAINTVINQTGGANGITRGLYVNPTLTAAADFRAIETARGNVVFGNLPTSSAGLPTGAIWNDAGTIKIV